MNVLSECNISVALGCSGPGGGVVIKIDVSHLYYVRQQRQEHSIHHSFKTQGVLSQLPPKQRRPILELWLSVQAYIHVVLALFYFIMRQCWIHF